MPRHRLPTVQAAAALLIACSLPAAADTNRPPQAVTQLPDVIVTATRTRQSALDLPYTAQAFSREEIQNVKLARTTPEILREVPGVLIQKTSHGQGSPYLRGFTGFRTLFLVDGIRLNNSTFRDGPNQYWNTVDPYAIDSFELVKGPSSVLYGSDAVGGTVNALTGSPFDLEDGRLFGARFLTRLSSAEDSIIVRAEGKTVVDGNFGIQAGVTAKDFGDLETGGGHVENSGYSEWDFDVKAEYRFNPDTRLTLAHQSVDQDDAWRTHATIYGERFNGTVPGSDRRRVLDQNRYLSYARFERENMDGWLEAFDATVSYHRQTEEQYRVRKDDNRDRQGVDVDTLGLSLQGVSPSRAGEWVYGVEYYRDWVDAYSRKYYPKNGLLKSRGIQGPVGDNSTYDNLGAYVQDTIPLHDQLDLVLGGRYTYCRADVDAYQDPATGQRSQMSDHWNDVAASGRLLYRVLPEQGVSLFAGVSQGFRAPNLSDLTRLDTARSSEIETPSVGLDPESFIAYELGAKVESRRCALSAAYFYTDIRDMIVRTPTGRIVDGSREVTKKNAGDGFVHGVELTAAYELVDDWTVWGCLTWMDGEVDGYPTSDPEKAREPVDRLMPLTATCGLRWEPTDRLWLEAFVTAADHQDDLTAREKEDTQRIPPGGTPGYAAVTARGGYRVTDAFSLSAAVENIGDADYRIHGSGINEPGRNFILTAEYRF